MANVRTYNRNVRVGNWREDATLEEESLKDFLHRKEKGQLTVQKTGMLRQNILKPVHLTVSQDGFLRYGDTVMLVNTEGTKSDPHEPCTLSIIADLSNVMSHSQVNTDPYLQGPCQVGGASSLKPCVRNAFVITSVDGTSNGTVLRYEESFALRTTAGFAGGLYLASDLRTFEKCAKLSRQQEVSLVEQHGFFCWWRVVYFDPQERLEHEGYPVQGNTKVLISHCKTNQCLAALANHVLWTPFGKEYEVTAHTFLDSHKAEQKSNHWMFITADPNEQEQSILQRQHVSPITHEHQPNPKTVIDTQGEKEN
ncbi:cilia- and flagella-associated protein 161 isoform X1 [Electrophorus electricus]|uniref:Cilia- and flagella-associated protein 161 n=1 Tax=Electrophorus electricus TaxID=8005 RepID=A0A4W4ENW6_ELEEL|nr:cilia- and flagella-associated protein 161 isoform X1 [Electrophorus electricus]